MRGEGARERGEGGGRGRGAREGARGRWRGRSEGAKGLQNHSHERFKPGEIFGGKG